MNDWLKYAEAKNAAMIAFAGAAAIGTGTVLSNGAVPDAMLSVLGWFSFVAFLLAATISLVSFAPSLQSLGVVDGASEGNLLFFGAIALLSEETYLERVATLLSEPGAASDGEARHLANQICINSRIAVRKLKTFAMATYAMAAGLAAMIVGFLLSLVF